MTEKESSKTEEEQHEEALQKTVGTGARLDFILGHIREGFSINDVSKVKIYIEKAEKELAKGGDWERKNKLMVYKGLLAVTARDFKVAAELFVKSLATFTPCDLLTFRDFVFYTIVTSLIALDRATLKNKILESPEILSVVGEIPQLSEFVTSLYQCRYKEFFVSFLGVIDQLRADKYLCDHLRYITRALRLVAYKQFLLSYKSVTIEMMAEAFGVTSEFIEEELSSFITAGKLNCKIDRINKYVESNRLDDPRNALYSKIIKQGDLLLNRIQKLSRVIDV
jgi:26S proteasome regulatory subunit N7